MASFALGAVGNFFGGPVGGFIGATIGSLIDNQLFPNKAVGPRLSDLKVTSSSYGNTIPLCYGPNNRFAGQLIWTTGLIETQSTTRQGGKGGPSTDVTEYSYRASLALAVCAGVIDGIDKILMNGKVVYDETASPPVVDWALWSSIEIYTGTGTQMPDPTIEADLGVGNTPAYRHTAYVVFSDLQLADFGNRLPTIEFWVRGHASIKLASVVLDLCGRAGLDTNQVSTSSLPNEDVPGFLVGNDASALGCLQQLSLVFNFDPSEEAGSLVMTPRDKAPVGLVLPDHLAGHEGNDKPPEAIKFSHRSEIDLPNSAVFTYPEIGRDLQTGSQLAGPRAGGSANSQLSAEATVALDAERAVDVADRLLWEAVNGSITAECRTDDRWLHMRAGQKYFFPVLDGWEAFRVIRKTRGADGVIELEIARDRDAVYVPSSTGVPSDVPPNEPQMPEPTILINMDAPLLTDDTDDTGFYWAVDTENGSAWRGAQILRSTDAGVSYDFMASTGRRAVIGTLEAALDNATATVWDRHSAALVRLTDPSQSLESVTEAQLLNSSLNAAWVGPADGSDGEIIQFANAQQISDDLWELTDFLRARKGTEYALANSAIGHRFVLLEPSNVHRVDYGAADWDISRLYKPVSLLTDETDATPQSFTNAGESKAPRSPVNAYGVRDGSGDVLIEWTRRSRLQSAGWGPTPLGEETEAYEIDIYSGMSVVRTESTTSPSFNYTSAMQTTDGFAPGDPVSIVIYQMSGVRGRGRPGTFTV